MAVTLRDFTAADAELMHRWFNDPVITEQLMERRESFSEEDARRWVERALDTEGNDRKWIVELDGRPIGFSALYGVHHAQAPELGIVIGERSAWGGGVGTEGMRLTIARGFDELGIHRVLELMLSDNERPRRVAEKLGFKLEGIMRSHVRRDGVLHDVAVYGLLPEDFQR
jgi:RimJ/RimL family protein N-acetyltransferase